MLTCYVVDDEPHAISLLARYIENCVTTQLVGSAQNPIIAEQEIIRLKPDITFLDINMPEMSGINLALSVSLYSTVIFTTAHAEHAAQAFDMRVADYLLKPFLYERFLQALERVERLAPKPGLGSAKKYFYVKSETKGKLVQIVFDDITYIEAALNYVIIHLEGSKHITYLTMKEIEQVVDPGRFSRVHKSYIVNNDKIRTIENGAVILRNNSMVLIGANYRTAFQEHLQALSVISKRSSS